MTPAAPLAEPARWRRNLGAIVAGVVVVGMALLCWNQIARDLGAPIPMQLAVDSSHLGLPRPNGGIATIHDYSVNLVDVDLTHISSQLQWMLGGDTALQFLLITAVLLTIGIVVTQTTAGRPFARSVIVSLVVLAIMVAVLGSAIEVLESFIGNREVYEAIGNRQNSTYFSAVAGSSFTGDAMNIALGIGTLASAFAFGARIERDRARLERDAEGLV